METGTPGIYECLSVCWQVIKNSNEIFPLSVILWIFPLRFPFSTFRTGVPPLLYPTTKIASPHHHLPIHLPYTPLSYVYVPPFFHLWPEHQKKELPETEFSNKRKLLHMNVNLAQKMNALSKLCQNSVFWYFGHFWVGVLIKHKNKLISRELNR